MTTTVKCTKTFNLSYPNVFYALYQAVDVNKQKLDLDVIQMLFKSSVKDDNTVTINKLNEVELGLTFTFDGESKISLDASKYEDKYGTNIVSLTLEDYKEKDYIDPDNSCVFRKPFVEKQNETELLEGKGTVYGTLAVATLAILSFAYIKTQ